MIRLILGSLLFLLVTLLLAAPVPREPKPDPTAKNSNKLLKLHKPKLKLEASSAWQSWPVEHLVDENEQTSWYSESGDSPLSGKTPWIKATFPDNVLVRRITLLGNRDPQYVNTYLVLAGEFELLDAAGKSVSKHAMNAAGEKSDFDWILPSATRVRSVKFSATKDQRQHNCVGLSELQIE